MKPEIGTVWVKIAHDNDSYNHIGDRVVIVPEDSNGLPVAWNYIPWVETNCVRSGKRYNNAWSIESFLKYYRPDDVYTAKKIIDYYDTTD